MTRGGGSGIVEGVRSRSGIAMANRCADDGVTALVVGERQPRRGFFLSFFSSPSSSFLFSPFTGAARSGTVDGFRKRVEYFPPTLSLFKLPVSVYLCMHNLPTNDGTAPEIRVATSVKEEQEKRKKPSR